MMRLRQPPDNSHRYRLRWLIAGTSLIVAMIVAANVMMLTGMRNDALGDVRTSLLRQSLSLSELIDRSLQTTDLVLGSVAEKIRREASSRDLQQFSTPEIREFLKNKVSELRQITTLGILDANGHRINRSHDRSAGDSDVADRDYFQQLKEHPQTTTFVGEPRKGLLSKLWKIVLAHPVVSENGKFLGVVYASTALQYFEELFRATSLGDGYAVALMRSDGAMLARYPLAGNVAAKTPVGLVTRLRSGEVIRVSSPIDEAPRIAVGHELAGFPLIVVVAQTDEAAFAPWRATALRMIAIAGVMIALSVVAAFLIARSWRQQEQLDEARAQVIDSGKKEALAEAEMNRQRDLAAQAARFNAALENMPQGLCMFDASQRLIMCNKRYAEMYGLDAEHTRPGTEGAAILRRRIALGTTPEDHEKFFTQRIAGATSPEPWQTLDVLADGRLISVVHRPMAGGGAIATHEDITEQRRSAQELDEVKTFLNSIIEHIPIGVVVKDVKTRKFVLVNRRYETMLKAPRSELIGRTVFDIYNKRDAEIADVADSEALHAGADVIANEYEVDAARLGMRTLATARIVVRDIRGEPKFLVVVVDDVTERKKSEQRIAFMAHHDALTGLANRSAAMQKIEDAVARQRRGGERFAVLLLDLDRFKYVNDTLGHAAGDVLLRETAARLATCLRDTDVLARLGGDEFAIVQLGGDNEREGAAELANRVIDIVRKPFWIDGHEVNIATSIGIALAPEHASDAESLLKMADMALYRAKASSRNGYCFFDPEMSVAANERRELENDLRRAVEQNELELEYQPIVDSKSGRICGAEALVRWRHPTRGKISPAYFIPVAEETGLITQIGEWVLRSACSEAARWPADTKVAVNLSPVQFRQSDLASVVTRALSQSGLSPRRLELEITETALIESAADCLPVLREFKKLGIVIAIDDFGTGYSSLSQLTMFPFDKIKIDKSFTQNLTKRADCAAIISATLTLANNLDIATTAEGVETAEQHNLLRLAGVTSMQGYLFKRPGPAAEMDFNLVYRGLKKKKAAA